MSVASLNTAPRRKIILKRVIYSSAAVVGYILSPLSWWNDLVVNIPIALAIATVLSSITGISIDTLFIAAYWATNIAGLILMITGGAGAVGGRVTRRALLLSLGVSVAYTVMVVLVLREIPL